MSRERVAPSADRASEPVIKVEEPIASTSRRSNDYEQVLNPGSPGGGRIEEEESDKEPLDDEFPDDESLDDEDEFLDRDYLHREYSKVNSTRLTTSTRTMSLATTSGCEPLVSHPVAGQRQ